MQLLPPPPPPPASIPALALLPARPKQTPPAASGPLVVRGRHPAPRPASHTAPSPPPRLPAARQGADLGACPRRAPQRRGPGPAGRQQPRPSRGPRRTEAAGPLLTGAEKPVRREGEGGGWGGNGAAPPSPFPFSPASPTLPSPGSPQRRRGAEPPSGAGRAEENEGSVPPPPVPLRLAEGTARLPFLPPLPAPPSPGVALAEGGFEQRRDVRALGLQIRRASLRHLLPPAATAAAAATAAGAGAGRAACWD